MEDERYIDKLLPTFKKFLIGSRVLEKLELTSRVKLETLAEVALNYPESLQQLREVINNGHIDEYMHQMSCNEYKKGVFAQYMKVQNSVLKHNMKLNLCNFYFPVVLRAAHKLPQIGENRHKAF